MKDVMMLGVKDLSAEDMEDVKVESLKSIKRSVQSKLYDVKYGKVKVSSLEIDITDEYLRLQPYDIDYFDDWLEDLGFSIKILNPDNISNGVKLRW